MGTDADFYRRRIRNPTSVPNFPLPGAEEEKELEEEDEKEALRLAVARSGVRASGPQRGRDVRAPLATGQVRGRGRIKGKGKAIVLL